MKVIPHATLIIVATVLALFSYLAWSFSPPTSLAGRDLLIIASAVSAATFAVIALRKLGVANTALLSIATFLLVLSGGAIINGQPKALDPTGIAVVAMAVAGALLAFMAIKELRNTNAFLVASKA